MRAGGKAILHRGNAIEGERRERHRRTSKTGRLLCHPSSHKAPCSFRSHSPTQGTLTQSFATFRTNSTRNTFTVVVRYAGIPDCLLQGTVLPDRNGLPLVLPWCDTGMRDATCLGFQMPMPVVVGRRGQIRIDTSHHIFLTGNPFWKKGATIINHNHKS